MGGGTHPASLLAVLGAPFLAGAAHAAGLADPAIRTLADNFHVIDESAAEGGSVSILTGPDGVLLVDTGIAALAPKVAAVIRALGAGPVRQIINTHVHTDETGGNEYFGQRGAIIIARTSARAGMLHPRTLADGKPRAPLPAASIPTVVYEGTMTLHTGGEAVQLIAAPPAHTDGDTLVYFPGPDILVAGDVLRPHGWPSINRPSGGTLPGMLDALALIVARSGPHTRIFTSHGTLVDRGAAIAQRDMILAVRERVATLIAEGRSEDEVVAARVTADFESQAPEEHTTAEHFIRDVYNEVKRSP